jgi:hypothetical protein
MSIIENDDTVELVEDELENLKQRADVLGIKYHPNIKLESLKTKVNDRLAGVKHDTTEADDDNAQPKEAVEETIAQKRRRIKDEALALVRIRVSCLNPAKKEWEGEIFTVGNSLIGSVTKYVPFNTGDDGYHVPQILLNQLRARECQVFITKKDERGNKVRKAKLIKEFGIEVLPPLTKAEIAELAQRQALSRATDD